MNLSGKNLAAFRFGRWKLLRSSPDPFGISQKKIICELYDLENDIGETTNIADQYPDIVAELEAKAAEYAKYLGDEVRGVVGDEIRPCLTVDNSTPLTEYDETHPYIILMYDKDDVG